MLDASAPKRRCGAIDTVTFGNGAEIEVKIGIVEAHCRRARSFREVELAPEAASREPLNSIRLWRRVSIENVPQLRHFSDCRIEATITRRRCVKRSSNDSSGFRCNSHAITRRARIRAADVGLRQEATHRALDIVELGNCRIDRVFGESLVSMSNLYFGYGTHQRHTPLYERDVPAEKRRRKREGDEDSDPNG